MNWKSSAGAFPLPLVSVIIPVYNRENLVGETLDSVIAQTYQNWECIVVDDGSTDRTREVVQSFCDKDPRIKLFSRPTDRPKGANACRNYGFERSSGEFVNWVDSDDILDKQKLSLQISIIIQTRADACVCQTTVRDIGSNSDLGLRAPNIQSGSLLDSYVKRSVFWTTDAPLWNRSTLRLRKLIWNESLTQSQDFDFHLRAILNGISFSFIEQSLVIARKHNQSISSQHLSKKSSLVSFSIVRLQLLREHWEHFSKESRMIFLRESFSNAHQALVNKSAGVSTRWHLIWLFSLSVITSRIATKKRISVVFLGTTILFLFFFIKRGDRLRSFLFNKVLKDSTLRLDLNNSVD